MYFIDFFAYIIFQILQIYKYAVIIYVILITLNFNIQYKNNISKNPSLGSFCEISFFSSNL